MNNKIKTLADLIGVPVEVLIDEVDEGMVDILIELNRKNYFTCGSCEGHIRNDKWNGYIAFKEKYSFNEYPVNYDTVSKKRCFYWNGTNENERRDFLNNLYEWALSLPERQLKEIKIYTLWGKNKRRPNGKWKVLKSSYDYDDIRMELNRKQTKKYDLRFEEKVVGRK